MFSQEELKNLLTLLNRVDMKGNEALPMAMLMQKINGLITPEQPKKEESKEEDKKENK